jgi:hypothetical protein
VGRWLSISQTEDSLQEIESGDTLSLEFSASETVKKSMTVAYATQYMVFSYDSLI